MNKENRMKVEFESRAVNESFARVTAAAFLTQLNPTLEELEDVKTAVSEAVTNAIIHGYESEIHGITMEMRLQGQEVEIIIEDQGCGIVNIAQAMEPLFTTKPELERSGMGFAFMEAFMDELSVDSRPGQGTKVTMKKIIKE